MEGLENREGPPVKTVTVPADVRTCRLLTTSHKHQRWIYVESQCETHRQLLRVKKGSKYEHLNIIILDFSLFPLGRPKRGGQILCPGNQNEVLRPHFVSPYLLQGQWRRINRLEAQQIIPHPRPGLIVVNPSPSSRMLTSVLTVSMRLNILPGWLGR